jgi:hypothetical protein
MGANSLEVLDPQSSTDPGRNFSLHDYRVKYQGSDNEIYWPLERRLGGARDEDWLHSDMAGIAYPYIHPFYQKMVNLTHIQEFE